MPQKLLRPFLARQSEPRPRLNLKIKNIFIIKKLNLIKRASSALNPTGKRNAQKMAVILSASCDVVGGSPARALLIRGGVTPSLPFLDKFMSCNHPRHAFKTGRLTENGKDEYIITDGTVDLLPFESASKQINDLANRVPRKVINGRMFLTDPLEIPCGSCVGCRMAHAKEWAVRCVLERDYFSQDDCYFLTLTYDNVHLPTDRQLCKDDLQKFWKRLRKAGYKFRYFACGEYGETYQRPHYHAIVFGLHLEDLRFYSLSDRKSTLYFSKTIEDAWPLGMSCLGYADIGSIAYTAGYVEKKQNDPNWNSYLVKPFVTMSRKPAIGTLYMLDNKQSILASNKVYGDFGSSHSHSVPRHFIRKLGEEDEYWLKGRSEVMKSRAEKAKVIEHCVYGCSDDDYLGFLKDELALQKISKIKRS